MIKHVIRQTCAFLASQICTARRSALETGRRTPAGRLDRLISHALIHRAAARGDHAGLRSQLAQYWQGSAATAFYEAYSDRFEHSFLGEHYCVIEALAKMLEADSPSNQEPIRHLYEIGCGDGQVLNHLLAKFPEIDEFVGLDINQAIIAKNRERYSDKKLSFQAGDAAVWLSAKAKPASILLSYGGVMEYFMESELWEIFKMLKQKSPFTIALVEPLYDGFDLLSETTSRSSGKEHSFTHNYSHLLEQAGFEICFAREMVLEFRWIALIAKG